MAAVNPNPVYDNDTSGKPVTRANLKALEGGGDTSEPKRGHLRAVNGDSSSGGGGAAPVSAINDAEANIGHSLQNQALSAATAGSGTVAKKAINFMWTNRSGKQKGLGFGAILTLFGVFFGIAIFSGPLQLIDLSQILKGNFSIGDHQSDARTSRLVSTFTANDAGETRLNVLSQKYVRGIRSQLSDIGVEFETNALGGLKSATVDTDKLAKQYPEIKDMSIEDQRTWLADRLSGLGVAPGDISVENGKLALGGGDYSIKMTSLIKKSSVKLLSNNGIISALKTHYLGEYLDVPSILTPFKKATSGKLNQLLSSREDTKAAQKAEQARETALTASSEAKADVSIKKIKDENSKYNSLAGKTLLFTGGVCLLRGVAGAIIDVNKFGVVDPSIAQATDKIAVGEQNKSMKNISLAQDGAVVSSLVGADGKNVFSAKALQAQEGVANPTGEDLPADYRQAFSSDTSEAKIQSSASKTVGGDFLAAQICSPIGVTVQLAGGLFLSAASVVAEVGSVGALTPAIAGGWAAKEGVSFAISAVAVHYVENFIIHSKTAGKLALDAFRGGFGGNLLAYGARAAANIASTRAGGVALSAAASAAIADQTQQEDQLQFQSKSMFARMFDTNDYHSLVNQVAMSTSPNVITNVSSVTGSITSMGTTLPRMLSSIFVPKTLAASSQPAYDWGFPQYGIPLEIMNDPNLANPYDNGDAVATLLDGNSPAPSSTPDGSGVAIPAPPQSYLDRAKSCFGVDIAKDDDGKWNVTTDKDVHVNPNSADYLNANCADLSDYNWRRVILFVFDTGNMQAMACFLGDDQSCQDIDVSQVVEAGNTDSDSDSDDDTGSTDTGSLPNGTSEALAKKLLPYISSGKIFCGGAAGGSESADCSDIQHTAAGTPIGGNCQVNKLTPHLLGLFLGLAQKGWSFGLSAICSDHHLEKDGPGGGHSSGTTADFSVQIKDGNRASGAAAASNEPFVNDVASLLDGVGGSFGQVGNCHPAYSSENHSQFTTFSDVCNHQHIRAAP